MRASNAPTTSKMIMADKALEESDQAMPFHFQVCKVSALEFAQRGGGGNEGCLFAFYNGSMDRVFMAYLKHLKYIQYWNENIDEYILTRSKQGM